MEITEKYVKLVHKIHRHRKKQSKSNTIEQMALYVIREKETITPLQLASELSLTPQMMSGVINALEEKQFIERKLCLKDKRKYNLLITEKGKEEAIIIKKKYLENVGKMLEYIGEEDVQHLLRIYEKILEHYSEEEK